MHKLNDGVVDRVLQSIVVDRGFEPRSDEAKDYLIDIHCFSTKQTPLRRKIKD
jgi:hypothetical protein